MAIFADWPEMTSSPLDVDALVAIDMHTHAEIDKHGHGSLAPELFGASPQIMSLLQSLGWDDNRVRRRCERLRRSVAEFREQQERAS